MGEAALAIETFADGAAWADACAARLCDALSAALVESGRAVFAGSGGSTPAPVYQRMASAGLDWSRVAVTLIDERYVPESSPDSNAALIKQSLLSGPAAAARFVPLYRPAVTVDRAAALAAHALAAEGGKLDAVLLGMGEDGHICSMFPDSPTLKTLLSPALRPTVLGVPHGRDGAAPGLERLTINLPYLMTARRVVLALTGAAKRAVFEREAAGDPAVQPIAALISANVPLDVLWTEKA
jgi:6-phosphogluconolactonase